MDLLFSLRTLIGVLETYVYTYLTCGLYFNNLLTKSCALNKIENNVNLIKKHWKAGN